MATTTAKSKTTSADADKPPADVVDQAAGDTDEPEPTHVHLLADGSTVPTSSPVATHHYPEGADPDAPPIRVMATFALREDV